MRSSEAFRETLHRVIGRTPQKEIAERTGISSSYISNMIRGGRIPSWDMLDHFCQKLGVTSEGRDMLFQAAGYEKRNPDWHMRGMEDRPVRAYPERVLRIADTMCHMTQRDIELVENMVARLVSEMNGAAYA